MRNAISGAQRNVLIDTALRGILAFRSQVTVPLLVHGTDAVGHRFSTIVDVIARRGERVDVMWQRAAQFAAEAWAAYGLSDVNVSVYFGSYGD